MNQKNKARLVRIWRNWIKPFAVVLVVFSTFRSAIADWNDVPSGSMKPTILEGDRIFVNKLAYDLKVPFTSWRLSEWADPERGDVIILYSPEDGTRLVKRVVGLPGDRLAMRNNRIYINSRPVRYAPLDRDTINQIDSDERSRHQFAAETLGDSQHPIMTTPPLRARRNFAPITLGDQQYFVMGDNRDMSRDSRYFGPVDRSLIVGRVNAVVLSIDRQHYYLPRWHRFFRTIP